MKKSMVSKVYDQSNNDDKKSCELYTINTQSSSSKPKENFHRKHWKNNLQNSVKQQHNILNKLLISRDESLIRVHHHRDYLKSIQNKREEIITINVSGNRYETRLSTLENYPNTLLGNKKRRKYYWNNEKNEYYFDRHRTCFEAILYYYQSNGRLRRPNYVPLDTFIEEILFFDLGPQAISQINKLENVSIIKYIDLPNRRWRRYIWYYLEYPTNSIIARIIYITSIFFTILSCIALAIETLPEYHNNSFLNISSPFFIIQTICVSYFTIEFLLRLISTPSYKTFLLSIFNWIDLSAILPYFVLLGFLLNRKESILNGDTLTIFRIFRLLRFLRVFKIYLIFKQFKSLRVLASTLKESFIEFIIMIIILTLLAFLFGAAVFFAEQKTNGDSFDSIPKATYWGIITITTVGYGDIYPVTIAGRILTCACAFLGLAISGMLISVLVEHYQRVYNRKQFLPEQIITAIDSSDSEQEEKQDFINRKLSGIRKNLSGGLIFPTLIESPNNNRKYKKSSSQVRFIIKVTEDEPNNNSNHNTANELMTELTETVKNTGEQINFELISADTDSSDSDVPTTTTNRWSLSSEE